MSLKSLMFDPAAFLLVFAILSTDSHAAPQSGSREEFAIAMSKIEEGTSEGEVLALLGKPDDIRTQLDPGGISRVQTKEVWCYGAKGHLGFPTLGCVYIDENGRSQEAFGGTGLPPKRGLFQEEELRDLLRLLDTVPRLDGYAYNPLPVIQIVNALQPLGKEKASATIGEYFRVCDKWSEHEEGMFLVLRVLFDIPKEIDSSKVGAFGMPGPAYPKNAQQIPRFPIALVDDIPLMLASGYMLAGMPEPMEHVLEFFKVNGRLRPRPLSPTNDPLATLEHLTNSSQWIYADPKLQDSNGMEFGYAEINNREKSMIMEQLIRLTDSVYRLPTDWIGNRLPCGEPPEPVWGNIVDHISKLKIRWDPKQNLYVFHDGSHLPEAERKVYRRSIWKLTGLGFDKSELVLERRNDSFLDVRLEWSQTAGAALRPGTLSVLSDDVPSPLLTFTFSEKTGKGGGTSELHTIESKTGSKLRAKLVIDGYQTNLSPVFQP